jgi:hypothetical protein
VYLELGFDDFVFGGKGSIEDVSEQSIECYIWT